MGITGGLFSMLMTWRHSGFGVFCSPRIQPGEEDAIENLARYIIRASFSQKKMTYIPEKAQVVYRPKDPCCSAHEFFQKSKLLQLFKLRVKLLLLGINNVLNPIFFIGKINQRACVQMRNPVGI